MASPLIVPPARRSILSLAILVSGMLWVLAQPASAQQRRARPPEYPKEAFRGVFFTDVREALRGERPRVDALSGAPPPDSRSAPGSGGSPTAGAMDGGSGAKGEGRWLRLAEAVQLEDEVKRLKLQYDDLVTTPSRFRSGGFQDARETLSILAMLMAVIADYDGRVRFQEDAALARDLFARSAKNVTAGSAETFDEAKQRKADLQDLVSGTGLNRADPSGATDWTLVGARTPLMNYLEDLFNDPLQSDSNDAAAVAESKEELDRAAALVAVVAEVLKQEGMDEADDADYRKLSDAMQQAALEIRAAIAENDADTVRQAVGRLGQSCSACHEQYR